MDITGKIDQAMPSKSGKTLRVSINNNWYSTKAFELQNMVGQTITGNTSVSVLPDGAQMQWLNDYVPGAGQVPPSPPVTADQAMQAAMQQPAMPAAPAPMPTPPVQLPDAGHKNRDASIVAQTLTKICSAPGDDPDEVWKRYTSFYAKYLSWDGQPSRPAQSPETPPPIAAGDDFDDSIPF